MFSAGTENLFRQLETTRRFPAKWEVNRFGEKETIHEWFQRIVDGPLEGEVGRCQIEERLGLFCVVKPHRGQVDYANLQAIVTPEGTTLENFYLDSTLSALFYRLDYDPSQPGPMFKEPLPHVHVVPSGAPRFALAGFGAGNLVVDFLDFLYRNHFYENVWSRWAREVWDRYRKERLIEVDSFDVVAEAFARGHHRALSGEYARQVQDIRNALVARYATIFPSAGIDARIARNLSFPPP